MQYLFGDTGLAAQRLKVLAEVFAESSRAFLLDMDIGKRRIVVDLGCGPGYSTHFLAAILPCDHVVGLDNSEHFLSLAQKTTTDRVSFYLHDITSAPFPVGPADLLYCRFLLTHLRDLQAIVARWGTLLRPKGLLLMEETEWIQTKNPIFITYLSMVEALLEHQSNRLYVGSILNQLKDTAILKRQTSQVRHLPVSNHLAATMFFLNIQFWKHQPFIQTHYSAKQIDQLEEDFTGSHSGIKLATRD